MPCLNEETSVGECVTTAFAALERAGWHGEVIVVDNGSSDQSAPLALQLGARVVWEPACGYGYACLAGLRAARGSVMVLGDADSTYDFAELSLLIKKIQEGCELVLGTRFRANSILPARLLSKRYLGNLALTLTLNWLFDLHLTDTQTGMRALRREAFERMDLRAGGMEFASEMLIHAKKANLQVGEVPIHYHQRKGYSKLRPFADGKRHAQLILAQKFGRRGDPFHDETAIISTRL